MGGSAVLDSDVLVDSLVVDVIDSLRDELHTEFGVRAYRAYTVHETWSGGVVGKGSVSSVETEITSQPVIDIWDGYRYELATCGIDQLGEIRLREVSLSYIEAELIGVRASMGKNQRFFWRIKEAHGQANRTKTFNVGKPPFVDREKDMGWVVFLRSGQEST